MLKRSAIVVMNTLLALFVCAKAPAATIATHKAHSKTHHITETTSAQKKMARMRSSSKTVASRNRSTHVVASVHPAVYKKHHYYERFYASSFANNQVEGDITAGEDPVVRAAAVEALGNMNGTIVAIDPDSGRILAMVNQKLALSAGAQPCSTIKVAVALAALSENVITKDTQVPLGKYWHVDLTTALAHSNNAYFEAVGRKLGFERVSYYAHQFGLGELAGWQHSGRAPGHIPFDRTGCEARRRRQDVLLRREHFLTPLQLAALMARSRTAEPCTTCSIRPPLSRWRTSRRRSSASWISARRFRKSPTACQARWSTARRGLLNQLHRGAGAGQDGHLLERRHALWLVRILRQHAVRAHRDGRLPGGRTADLRAQGGRVGRSSCTAISTTTNSSPRGLRLRRCGQRAPR